MLNFYFSWTRYTTLLFLLTVIFIGASFFLPVEYSYENHLLENLEVVILFVGFLLSLINLCKEQIYECGLFYIGSAIIYLLMIGRELSWGRVFYPIGIDNHGEQIFIKVQQLWYGSIVYPIITLLIILAIALLSYFAYSCRTRGIRLNIPVECLALFVLMSVLSQCVFDRGLLHITTYYNQLLEENCEIIAYLSLVLCSYKIYFKKIYIRIKYFQIKLNF